MTETDLRPSPISPTVDFDRDGVQHGFLRLPYSRDDSAWGSVMIPITVIRNGEGPTALLTGGNHGDEYEGPIALFDLARTLKAEDVSGTVIIVPAMNYPAFRAGTRTSPIDKGNMNRSFPGRPDGTVTEKIADYFQRELLPLADIVLDFHSGGKTLDFLPFCAAHILPDKAQEARLSRRSTAFCGALFDEDARDRRGRHVRHRGRGDGQGLRHHRTRRRRHARRRRASRIAKRGVMQRAAPCRHRRGRGRRRADTTGSTCRRATASPSPRRTG